MIKNINLKNFRLFDNITFETSNSLVIFSGKNATGKTSILESIYICSTGKSHRDNDLENVIKKNMENSIIEIGADKRLKVVITNKEKNFFLNNKEINVSNFIGNIKAIMISPSDLSIIDGKNQARRHFLDLNISLVNKKYLNALKAYKKLLKERNELLKQENVDLKLLDVLTDELIEYLNVIYSYRIDLINKLNNYLVDISKNMNIENIRLAYVKSYDDDIKKSFKDKLKYDLLTKTTNIGIHRDTFNVFIDDMLADNYASEGQRKTIVFSIKVGLIKYIKEITGEDSIVLLDDIFAAMDNTRIEKITNYIKNFKQTFISTTSIIDIPDELLKKSLVIRL